jgi:hypothetical protein
VITKTCGLPDEDLVNFDIQGVAMIISMKVLGKVSFSKLSSIIFLSVCVLLCSSSRAQTSPDTQTVKLTFEVSSHHPESPVQIEQIEIDGKSVPFGTPVEVSAAWMQKMVVFVKNVSPKSVVQGGLILTFPETGSGNSGDPMVASLASIGQRPKNTIYSPDGTPAAASDAQNPPINVPTNQLLRFTFSDDSAMKFASQKAPQITRVRVGLGTFFFEDSTAWNVGVFSAPGIVPGTWDQISLHQFLNGGKLQN